MDDNLIANSAEIARLHCKIYTKSRNFMKRYNVMEN